MLRRTLLILALSACAGAAHAADRYGASAAASTASEDAYRSGAAIQDRPLLTWNAKAPAPQTRTGNFRDGRPAPVSAWAKKAEAERAAKLGLPEPDQTAPQPALPTSLYSPAPGAPVLAPGAFQQAYKGQGRPAGQPIELSPDAVPSAQPSLAQQQARQEEADMLEAKIARARAQDAKDRADGKVVINSQDVVR